MLALLLSSAQVHVHLEQRQGGPCQEGNRWSASCENGENVITIFLSFSLQWTPIQVQAIIIASYAEPVTAEQCAVVTEKLGDYLVSVGYWTFLLHIFANFWCSAFGPFSQICRYWIHCSYLFSISFIIDSSGISGRFMEEICLVSRATKTTFLVSLDFWALQLISLDKHGVENLLLRNSAIDIFLWF